MLEELIQYQVFSPENNDFQKKSKKQFLYGIKHVCFLFLIPSTFTFSHRIFQFLSRAFKPLATLLWKLQNQVEELWQ